MTRSKVCQRGQPPVKAGEDLLTDAEVQQLMAVYVRDKTTILEEDYVTLLKWARGQRFRSLLLGWVLDGSVHPCVVNGDVCFTLPPGAEEP